MSRVRQATERSGYAVSPIDGSRIYYRVNEPLCPALPDTPAPAERRSPAGRPIGHATTNDLSPPGNRDSPVSVNSAVRPDASGSRGDTGLSSAASERASGATTRTIVLCDGVGCDGYVWKYLYPVLNREYRIVRWHYRGHGQTPMPRDRTRIDIVDHADDLGAVLDACDIGKAVLMGHSMGVQVSLELFRRQRARVAGLILVCGAPGEPLSGFRHPEAAELLLAALRDVVGRAPRLFNGLMKAFLPTDLAFSIAARLEIDRNLIDQVDFMPYLHGMARIDLRLFLDMVDAAQRHSAVDVLPEVDVPTLVIAGSNDGFTSPLLSQTMYDEIPDAELRILERGTHTAPLEYPDLVCQTVLDFLHRRLI